MIDRKILDRKMKTGISGMSTGLRMGSFPSTLLLIFLSKIFLSYMALSVPLRADIGWQTPTDL